MVPARACSSSPSNGERRNRSPSETKFRVLEEITCLVAEFLLKKFFSKLSQAYQIESGREMFELEVKFDTNYMVRKSHFFGIDLGNLDLNLFFFAAIHGSSRIQDRATVWPGIEQVQEAEWPATCDVCRTRAPLMLLKLHSITLSALGLT